MKPIYTDKPTVRDDFTGFTIGPVEVVFWKRWLTCIAINYRKNHSQHTWRPFDRQVITRGVTP